MMWRYYELLTDVRVDQIASMKADASSGKAHPMDLKKELSRSIVADFHSPEAAAKAGEDWAKQFQKGGVPDDIEEVIVSLSAVEGRSEGGSGEISGVVERRIKLDKLLFQIGLADSVSDAVRKIKQKAVKVNGELKTDPVIFWNPKDDMTLKAGRKIKKVIFKQ
jgi:tyrosyl-tRNA synthetase